MSENMISLSEEYFERLRRYEDAENFAEEKVWLLGLLERYPDDYNVIADISRVFDRMGDMEGALAYAQRAYSLCKSSRIAVLMAFCLYNLERYREVIALVEEYVSEEDDFSGEAADIFFASGYSRLLLRDFEAAMTDAISHLLWRDEDVTSVKIEDVRMMIHGIVSLELMSEMAKRGDTDPDVGLIPDEIMDDFYDKLDELMDLDDNDDKAHKWLLSVKKKYYTDYIVELKLADVCLEDGLEELAVEHAYRAFYIRPEEPACLDMLIESLWVNHINGETVYYADRMLEYDAGDFDSGYTHEAALGALASAAFYKASALCEMGVFPEARKAFALFKKYDSEGADHGLFDDEISRVELTLSLVNDNIAN